MPSLARILFFYLALLAFSRAEARQTEEVNALNDQGLKLLDAGKNAEAKALFDKALQLSIAKNGDREEFTSPLRMNIADALTRMGKFAEAVKAYDDLLARAKRTFGEGDVRVAELHRAIGLLLYRVENPAGQESQRETHFLESYRIYEAKFGKDHDATLEAKYRLGDDCAQRNAHEKAIPLFEDCISRWLKTKPEDSDEVLSARSRIADIHQRIGRSGEADAIYSAILELLGRKPEKERAKFHATVLSGHAMVLFALSRYAEQERALLKAIELTEKHLPGDVRDLAGYRERLAGFYSNQGDFVKAAALFDQALGEIEKNEGRKSTRMASALDTFAHFQARLGKYAEAEKSYRESLAIYEAILGPNDTNVAAVLVNSSHMLMELGKEKEAEANLLRSLKIWTAARLTCHL